MNGNHIAAAATDKLRDEMARKHDSAGVAGVGEVMTALLQAHPEYAPGILAEGKTLQGAYDALEKYARDHRGGAKCVYVPQATAEKVLLQYYGIRATEKAAAQPAPSPETDDLDLDALLEGL